MNRREALARTTLLLGGTLAGAEFFLAGCKRTAETVSLFSADDILLLDEVGETILPATPSSPGAKAAHIGAFMKVMVTDCYDEKEQSIFTEGITLLKSRSQETYQKDFLSLTGEEKENLLVTLDAEAKAAGEAQGPHYFSLMKQLTLLGYFSSEVGATQALRYVPVPGRFEGCVEYKKGEKAWAI